MKTLTITLTITDETFQKMIDYFYKADQTYLEEIISNNLEADLEDGDLSILDIMKPSKNP
jgi:hypothetical protein